MPTTVTTALTVADIEVGGEYQSESGRRLYVYRVFKCPAYAMVHYRITNGPLSERCGEVVIEDFLQMVKVRVAPSVQT